MWHPNIGLPKSYITTASQDKTVLIQMKETPTSLWIETVLDLLSSPHPSSTPAVSGKFPDVIWHMSWAIFWL
jgi:protein transport protein SEC13